MDNYPDTDSPAVSANYIHSNRNEPPLAERNEDARPAGRKRFVTKRLELRQENRVTL